MARSSRAYRGAKRQKELVRKARQEEKRRRRLERRLGPQHTEPQGSADEGGALPPPGESPGR